MINVQINSIAITGHRPDELGGYGEDSPVREWVKDSLKTAFDFLKPETVIVGMALGVDQWAAEVCMRMGIPFVAAIPFLGQESIWPVPSRENYHRILSHAHSTVIVSQGEFAAWKMQKRNEYMVDHADVVVAVWNGKEEGGTYNCVKYALKTDKPIVQINPKDFK